MSDTINGQSAQEWEEHVQEAMKRDFLKRSKVEGTVIIKDVIFSLCCLEDEGLDCKLVCSYINMLYKCYKFISINSMFYMHYVSQVKFIYVTDSWFNNDKEIIFAAHDPGNLYTMLDSVGQKKKCRLEISENIIFILTCVQ